MISFILKTPLHSILIVGLLASLPLLSLLSAAIVALTTLQKGFIPGLIILLVGALPTSIWMWTQVDDVMPLVIFPSSFLLAALLRQFVSWEKVLLASIPIALLSGWILLYWQDPSLEARLQSIIPGMFDAERFESIRPMVMCVLSLYVLLPLFIARWMQSYLYEGNKFRSEFHNLRLSVIVGAGLIVAIIGCSVGDANLIIASLVIPFVLSGLSLVHCWMAHRKLAFYWTTIFYTLLFMFSYSIFAVIILGMSDSLFNLRKRFL